MLRETHGRSKPCAACSHDHGIVLVIDHFVFLPPGKLSRSAEPAARTSVAAEKLRACALNRGATQRFVRARTAECIAILSPLTTESRLETWESSCRRMSWDSHGP